MKGMRRTNECFGAPNQDYPYYFYVLSRFIELIMLQSMHYYYFTSLISLAWFTARLGDSSRSCCFMLLMRLAVPLLDYVYCSPGREINSQNIKLTGVIDSLVRTLSLSLNDFSSDRKE
jgi:hypothetical protein